MNKALIDTDILSYYLKGNKDVIIHFEEYLNKYNVLEISIITYYEIVSGLQAKNALKQLSVFEDFVAENNVLPLTKKSTQISAKIYGELRKVGNTVDDIDLLIAGIAIENKLTLITNNSSHFGRIPKLKTDNWKKI